MAGFSTVRSTYPWPGLEKRPPQPRANVPVALQGIDIREGDAAAQVTLDILQVLGRLAVDVARQVEVEVVLLDLGEGHHAGVLRHVTRLVKTSTILWMSMLRSRFLGPSFMKSPLASIMKTPLRAWASSLSTTTMQAGMPVP